jgi:hypothetical protein
VRAQVVRAEVPQHLGQRRGHCGLREVSVI